MKRIIVYFVLFYLRLLTQISLRWHKPIIIGIAGSVGKSSAQNAIYAILRDHYPTRTVGNSETGIPLGILGIVPHSFTALSWLTMLIRALPGITYLRGTTYLIAEMGIDDPFPPKNMEFLLTIIKPTIAIELNVSVHNGLPPHAMQFEKLLLGEHVFEKHDFLTQKIAQEDTKIITKSDCKIGIYNIDDLHVQKELVVFEIKHSDTRLLTFGMSSQNDISYGLYKIDENGCVFGLLVKQKGQNKKIVLSFENQLLPKEYREVFAAAVLVGLEAGLSLHQITASLQKNFSLPKGRAGLFKGINGSIIIDSSYNASRESVFAFLDMVQLLKKQTKRVVVILFGDMRELGSEAEKEHVEVARRMQGIVDYLYLVGEQTKEFVYPLFDEDQKLKQLRHFDNAREAGLYLKNHLPPDSIVLVKGSQNTIFLEEAIKFILQNKDDERNLCRQDYHFLALKLQQYGS